MEQPRPVGLFELGLQLAQRVLALAQDAGIEGREVRFVVQEIARCRGEGNPGNPLSDEDVVILALPPSLVGLILHSCV